VIELKHEARSGFSDLRFGGLERREKNSTSDMDRSTVRSQRKAEVLNGDRSTIGKSL